MIDIVQARPIMKEVERSRTNPTRQMFAAALHSPNLLEGEELRGSLHESPVFFLNGRPCRMRYSYTHATTAEALGTATIQIVTPDGNPISENACTFAQNPERGGADIVIGQRFDTAEQFRESGFGSVVALLTNDLIEHTMGSQPELRGKRAVSMLFDETENEWSSRKAHQLGFQELGRRIWIKEYRG